MAVGDPARVPLLWSRHSVTLLSALTLREVRERLGQILPRFAVPSGVAIPRFGFARSRYYLGSLREEHLTLNGPYGGGGRHAVPALLVQATITSDGEGTLIHLSVRPAMAIFGLFVLCASGVIAGGLFAVLDHVIAFPLGLLVGFSLLGVVVYAIGRWNAVNRLNELLGSLEDLLNARRRT